MTPPTTDDGLLGLLRSPLTGGPLREVAPSLLDDGETLWPVLDGIPYLRLGRDELRGAAVRALQRQDAEDALALLLADRKDETIPPADPESVRRALSAPTARQAMTELGYGSLAEYFLHRWSHPSYLSGLALLESHSAAGESLFEVACGAGHFLRPWLLAGGRALGGDTVFSHLWLSRRFTAPDARLVCFDAEGPFPFADGAASLTFSNDSFHYFRRKAHVFAELQRISAGGRVLLGHVHNAAQRNFSPGEPLPIEEYQSMLQPAVAYDDAELARSALEGRAARPATVEDLSPAAAAAFVCGPAAVGEGPALVLPPAGTALDVNPLLSPAGPRWPNQRFEEEFARSWVYLSAMRYPPKAIIEAAARGEFSAEAEIEGLCRKRTLLNLPERWL
ncbi:MAG: methyltransferase domain-containing protein [Acidobacteriota bacterium]